MQIKRPVCMIVCFLLPMILWINCRKNDDSVTVDNETIPVTKCVTGTVKYKESKLRFGQEKIVLFLETEETTAQDNPSWKKPQIMCYLREDQNVPYIGQTVTVNGTVASFSSATNPGEFDQKNYYQILNISYKLLNSKIQLQSKSFSFIKENLYRIKRMLEHAIDRCFAEPEAGVLKAMLLGNKSTLDTRLKEVYQFAGIIHILAISGVHVTLLGMGIYRLLFCFKLPKFMRILLTALVMIAYGIMTGWGISCIRAIMMFGLKLLAEFVGRSYDVLTALALAGMGILCEQPLYLKHSGFLMSFGAVLGIIYVFPWLQNLFYTVSVRRPKQKGKEFWHYFVRKMRDGLLVGMAIAIATLPIQLSFYYMYSISSLLVNLLVIPTIGVLLLCAALAMLCSLLTVLLGVSCGSYVIYIIDFIGHNLRLLCESILELYEKMCLLSVKQSWGMFVTGKPAEWQIIVYYVLFIGMLAYTEKVELRKKQQIPRLFQIQILLIALCILCRKPAVDMQVHFLDVGQGDCIIIVNDNGNAYMIDGGSTSKSEVGKYQIIPFLKSLGICELEAVFVTHPDEDHVNGIEELLTNTLQPIRIKQLILPDISTMQKETELAEICQKASDAKVSIAYMHRGQVLTDDNLQFVNLNPKQAAGADDINELSQVLAVSYLGYEMLLTGDVTGVSEQELCTVLEQLQKHDTSIDESHWRQIDVLKVAHHGSKYSTPMELLQILKPMYAVISAGRENLYGHPHTETLERLAKVKSEVLDTPQYGAITIKVSSGGKISVSYWRKDAISD